MLRSIFVLLSVILAVTLLPQGTLASDDGMEHQLQKTTTARCPTPYLWTKPSWWLKYKRQLTNKVLKTCLFLQGKVPANGSSCKGRPKGIVCMFGEARCNNVDEPETKCQCTNGVWVCNTVCDQPKCPIDMPTPSGTCDPLVHVKSCDYGEHCCADTCSKSAFCRCETFQGQSTWLCAVASMMPCYEKSLEEAGCPCDRPKDGNSCTGDYGCGDACCGADAYTCKCNSAGVYENCGKTGFIPLDRRDLSAITFDEDGAPHTNLVACACAAP